MSEEVGAARLVDAVGRRAPHKALEILRATPEAARGRTESGLPVLLWALYHGVGEVVAAIRAARDRLTAFEAAALGEVPALLACLDADPSSVTRRSPDGFTPLHLAAYFASLEAARVLLARGAPTEVAAENPSGAFPLHSAAASRRAEGVALLLGAGARPDVRQGGGYTALHAAARHGDLPMVRVLLAHGADPAPPDAEGRTPRDYAAAGGHGVVAAELERWGG